MHQLVKAYGVMNDRLIILQNYWTKIKLIKLNKLNYVQYLNHHCYPLFNK